MGYNTFITNSNVDNLPVDAFDQIFQDAEHASVVMSRGQALRQMTQSELKLKVNTALPSVYFVATRGSEQPFTSGTYKQTTTMTWTDETITAEELAALVVIPNNVVADASFDVYGEIRRAMPTAIAKAVDAAVIFGTQGTDSPSTWPTGIFTGMPAAMQFAIGANGDIYDDTLGISGTFARVENKGFDVNASVGAILMKAKFRNLREKDAAGNYTGQPLFGPMPIQGPAVQYGLNGTPVDFPKHGGWDATKALLISGDWSTIAYSIAQDVRFEMFDQGVIQDPADGSIKFNLMQQDLTAMRVTFRMGWQLPATTIKQWLGTTSPYPFSAIKPS